MNMDKAQIISEQEKLCCSLVSGKLSYEDTKSVIDEACIHQNDADHDFFTNLMKQQKEELRVGNILTAKLTDKCRELEAQLQQQRRRNEVHRVRGI